MSNTYKKKVNKLYNLLDEYLHYSKANYNIIETFIRIHNKVASKYQSKIMSLFHQKLTNFIKKMEQNIIVHLQLFFSLIHWFINQEQKLIVLMVQIKTDIIFQILN